MPVADCARPRGCSRGARRRRGAYILTARGAEQHAKGTDTVTAFDQPRPRARPARPARLRLRLPHRPGQRPGRPRARPEGRPAARLPARSTTRPPARTSPRCGASTPDVLPGPGVPAYRAARRARHRRTARGRCWCSAPTWSSPRPTPRRSRERLAALDLLVVCDFVLSETAALADVVLPVTQWAEEDGTMTNLEGRVLRRRRRVDAARRGAHRPGGPGRARRAGSGAPGTVADRPARGLRRAAPGQRRRPRRLRRHQPTSGSTPRTACSGPARDAGRHPGHAAAVPRPLRRPRTAGPGFVPVDHRPAAEDVGADVPALPDDRPGAGALPVRRADPAGRRAAAAAPGAVRRAAPATLAERLGRRPTGDAGAGRRAARGRSRAPARVSRRRSGPTPSSCRSTGPARAGQPAHQRRARPGLRMPEFKVCAVDVVRSADRD